MKNGSFFLTLIDAAQREPGVWDPHFYRGNGESSTLGQFVRIERLGTRAGARTLAAVAPIEYRHIPRGSYATFALEDQTPAYTSRWPVAGEEWLLFGTMRAYLGNVLVTPRAEWLGMAGPLLYPVKSEFVRVVPQDGLTYYWWAYLRSPGFRRNLPLGSGGTRPRQEKDVLLMTPVSVPDTAARRQLDIALRHAAESEWTNYAHTHHLLGGIGA
jgi:hypothetical protein